MKWCERRVVMSMHALLIKGEQRETEGMMNRRACVNQASQRRARGEERGGRGEQ